MDKLWQSRCTLFGIKDTSAFLLLCYTVLLLYLLQLLLTVVKYVASNSSSVLVKDIMSKALISVNPITPAFQIAKMMQLGEIGAILVKENEAHVGIITDRDFATKITAKNLPFDTPVKKIMSSPLITINHKESIFTAAKMMSKKKVRKLAVAEEGKIIGLITSTDLVNQLSK